MATITFNKAPHSRIAAGAAIVEAAKTIVTKPIKNKLDAFQKAHREYEAAELIVEKADATVHSAEAAVGILDDAQDEAVNDLAAALIGDRYPRVHPFKAFGVEAPSILVNLGYAVEAKKVKALAVKVIAKKGLSPKSIAAAKAAQKAAIAVEQGLVPIAKLKALVAAARSRRDALGQPWETTLAALKRAARTAEDDGAKGVYSVLFESTAKPVKKKKVVPPPAPAK